MSKEPSSTALTTDELQAALEGLGMSVSYDTLARWRRAGMPCVAGPKKGGWVRYFLPEVLSWLRQNNERGTE